MRLSNYCCLVGFLRPSFLRVRLSGLGLMQFFSSKSSLFHFQSLYFFNFSSRAVQQKSNLQMVSRQTVNALKPVTSATGLNYFQALN